VIRQNNTITVANVSLSDGLCKTNLFVTKILQEGYRSGSVGLDWKMSSLGDSLLAVCYEGDEQVLKLGDLLHQEVRKQLALPDSSGFWNIIPQAGTNRWLVCKFVGHFLDGLTVDVNGSTNGVHMRVNEGSVIGYEMSDLVRMVSADIGSDAAIHEMKMFCYSIGNHAVTTNLVSLPIFASVQQAQLSPDGKRIIWHLMRQRTKTTASLVGSFPFISVQRTALQPARSSLWISQSDGTNFRCLFEATDDGSVGKMGWCAEGNAVIIRVGNKLFSVPIVEDP
jgi:hypothetical protein